MVAVVVLNFRILAPISPRKIPHSHQTFTLIGKRKKRKYGEKCASSNSFCLRTFIFTIITKKMCVIINLQEVTDCKVARVICSWHSKTADRTSLPAHAINVGQIFIYITRCPPHINHHILILKKLSQCDMNVEFGQFEAIVDGDLTQFSKINHN